MTFQRAEDEDEDDDEDDDDEFWRKRLPLLENCSDCSRTMEQRPSWVVGGIFITATRWVPSNSLEGRVEEKNEEMGNLLCGP